MSGTFQSGHRCMDNKLKIFKEIDALMRKFLPYTKRSRSICELVATLEQQGIKPRRSLSLNDRTVAAAGFTAKPLAYLLKNFSISASQYFRKKLIRARINSSLNATYGTPCKRVRLTCPS